VTRSRHLQEFAEVEGVGVAETTTIIYLRPRLQRRPPPFKLS